MENLWVVGISQEHTLYVYARNLSEAKKKTREIKDELGITRDVEIFYSNLNDDRAYLHHKDKEVYV